MIQNAKIISHSTPPETYNTEEHPRGSAKLTVRAHILSEVLRNAQRWVRGYESPGSKAQKFGSLLDCLLLTPKQWPSRYAVVPPDAPRKPSSVQRNAKKPSPETVAAIEWWDAWLATHRGEIITAELSDSVYAARERLREDKVNSELIDCSQRQVMISAEWMDKPTGLTVPVKGLIDLVPPAEHPVFSNSLWDLKTTKHASPFSFRRDAQKFAYHIQAALYLDLYNSATGEQRSDFGHVVIENFHPYEYRTPPPLLSQRAINFGRFSYQVALSIYCKALSTGEWPSYDLRGKEWPITDFEDWFLNPETLLQPIEEPEEEEEEMPTEEPADVTP